MYVTIFQLPKQYECVNEIYRISHVLVLLFHLHCKFRTFMGKNTKKEIKKYAHLSFYFLFII